MVLTMPAYLTTQVLSLLTHVPDHRTGLKNILSTVLQEATNNQLTLACELKL